MSENNRENPMSKGPRTVVAQLMDKDTREALARIAGSKAGRKVLKWLMNYCGYKYSSLTMTPDGVLLVDAIVHNEAKRAVWLDIRKNITPSLLDLVERESTDES